MKIITANRVAPDGTPRFLVSYLGLFCLPLSKKDAMFILVNYLLLPTEFVTRPGERFLASVYII